MRIVHYMAGFQLEAGGVTRAVMDLCGTLAGRGHEVTLLTLDRADLPESWEAGRDGVPAVTVLRRRTGPVPRLAADARAAARDALAAADVAHLHVPWDAVCIQLGRIARAAGRPYILSLHGMLDEYCMSQRRLKKRAYLALGGRRLLERAWAVHCTAEAERRQSQPWFPRGRAAVVPLIFDLTPYLELPGPEAARVAHPRVFAGGPLVLYVGRLHPMKRIEVLIDAMALLGDARLAVAGSGEPDYERTLRRRAADRGLADRVVFAGFVTDREKVSLYQAADVFVLPSHHENWGFVSVEALACATPVVTVRDVNIWPELEASGGAEVVEATPEGVAAAVSGLLADPRRARVMGEKGRAWVLRELGPDRVARRYEDLYREAAS